MPAIGLKQRSGSLLLHHMLPAYFLDCGEIRGARRGAGEAGAMRRILSRLWARVFVFLPTGMEIC